MQAQNCHPRPLFRGTSINSKKSITTHLCNDSSYVSSPRDIWLVGLRGVSLLHRLIEARWWQECFAISLLSQLQSVKTRVGLNRPVLLFSGNGVECILCSR